MVWGCINAYGMGSLHVLEDTMGRGSGGPGLVLRSGTNMTWATKKHRLICMHVCSIKDWYIMPVGGKQ